MADINPTELSAFNRRFAAARTYLTLGLPFYAALLAHCQVIPDHGVERASINAKSLIRINPTWFLSLPTIPQCAFVLAHECLHVCLGIFWRAAKHNRALANIAHDYVINLLLAGDSRQWVLPNILLSREYRGLSYEEVYSRLRRKANEGEIITHDWIDADFSTTDYCPADAKKEANAWSARIIAASLYAKSVGRMSASAEEIVAMVGKSVVPWQEKLRLMLAEFSSRAQADWSSPSRRSQSLDFFAPRITNLGFEPVVIIDTSGSISCENLQAAIAEISEIIELAGGNARWLSGDAEVLADETVHRAPQTVKGRGGTSFAPFFEHLERGPAPHCVIYFTDTFGDFGAIVPTYPVIWAVYDSVKDPAVPFGEIIVIPANPST